MFPSLWFSVTAANGCPGPGPCALWFELGAGPWGGPRSVLEGPTRGLGAGLLLGPLLRFPSGGLARCRRLLRWDGCCLGGRETLATVPGVDRVLPWT